MLLEVSEHLRDLVAVRFWVLFAIGFGGLLLGLMLAYCAALVLFQPAPPDPPMLGRIEPYRDRKYLRGSEFDRIDG